MRKMIDIPPIWGAGFWAAIFLWSETVTLVSGPGALSAAGAALIVLGLGFILWSAAQYLGRDTPIEPHHTPRTLIATGPYRLVRHPIYRGLLWATLGFAIFRGEMTGLIFPGLYALVLYRRFVLPEERALEEAFGDEYRAWARTVRARL
jgi:protein-S-isoprenylcysteine O-methyltransferase Ste14